ncbi:MAG: hypothetical protein RL685_6647 [Pseudomonadota bacterium]|jgi:hypothetical protein
MNVLGSVLAILLLPCCAGCAGKDAGTPDARNVDPAGERPENTPPDNTVPNTGPENSDCPGSSHPFFQLARQASGQSPVELTAAEVVERAGIIALGRLSAVSRGHTVDYREGASSPVRTVVMSFRIEKTLKGPESDFQYVEYVSGTFEAGQFAEQLPVEMPLMIFLRLNTTWSSTTYVIQDEGLGVPEGQVLRSFFPLVQVVIDCRQELEFPLGDETGGQLFRARSLVELENEIRGLSP